MHTFGIQRQLIILNATKELFSQSIYNCHPDDQATARIMLTIFVLSIRAGGMPQAALEDLYQTRSPSTNSV